MTGTSPPLALAGIAKSYPGVQALDGVDVSFQRGSIHAVLGENGAGKSTLLKIICGVEQPTAGQVFVDGAPRTINDPRTAAAFGISMVHQELSIVAQLTLAENVVLGREHARFGVRSIRYANKEARRCLGMLGWYGDVTRRADTYSVATQQLAEIARALFRDQRVIILDEPTASLTQPEVERLLPLLRQLRDDGRTIVYVSHRLAEIAQLDVNHITVLRDGRRSGQFFGSDDVTETDLVRAMVGRSIEVRPLSPRTVGDTVLELRDVRTRPHRPPVDLVARAGEVVAIAGMVGSGRTTLLRTIFGADQAASGEIRIGGRSVRHRRPTDGIRSGVALLTEDRKSQGLGMNLSIASNITLVEPPARCGVISRRQQRARAHSAAHDVGLRRDVDAPVRTLSGGNQQKAVFARWRLRACQVYLFDEPTRGVDVGAKEEIYALIESLAESGAAVLVVSSDLPEVLALGDRVLVMRDGAVVAEHHRAEVTEEVVVSDATRSEHADHG